MSQRSCFTYGSKSIVDALFLRVFLLLLFRMTKLEECVFVCVMWSAAFVHVLRNYPRQYRTRSEQTWIRMYGNVLTLLPKVRNYRFFWKQIEINILNTKSNDIFCIKYRYMWFSYFLLCSVCYNFTQWTPNCSFIHIHHPLLFCINEILCCCFTSKPNVP